MTENNKNNVGRPSTIDEEVIALLVASFQNGLNIGQACLQAGISKDAYYRRMNQDDDFAIKMNKAQEFPNTKARQNLVKKIAQEDEATSKWWLERRDPEFKPKSDVTTDENPIQLILQAYGLSGGENDRQTDEGVSDSSESQT